MFPSQLANQNARSNMYEKPQPHYTTDNWKSHNSNLQKITDRRTLASDGVRQAGSQLRSATENTTRWKLKETNNRMQERITETDQWYNSLEFSLTDLKNQIQKLSEAKVGLEGSISDLLLLQEATKEVILLRDRRREVDLVEDQAYQETKKELKLIDNTRAVFCNLADQAFLQLLDMKSQRDLLVTDLEHKQHAIKIDQYKVSLSPNSEESIGFKPKSLELPENIIDEDTWLRNCLQRKQEAEACIVRAMQLTNDIWGTMKTKIDDVKKQREKTQRELRKRLHDTTQTRDKLGAQRKDLQDEIEKVGKEMREIETTISEKITGKMKLAETRLENRKWRRGFELCLDISTKAISEELEHVRKSKQTLEKQLADVRNNLNCLQHQLREVEDDLERKERSLEIEKTCLEIHTKPRKAPYQADIAWRAMKMTTLDVEEPQELNESLSDHRCAGDQPDVGDVESGAEMVDQATMTEPDRCEEYELID